jgi:hypothetical protein
MNLIKSLKRYIIKNFLKRNLPLSLTDLNYSIPTTVKILDPLPGNKIFCNINFDDLCPKYYDEDRLDCGGNISKGLSVELKKFLETYPDVSITFFVIPSCISLSNKPRQRGSNAQGCNIDSPENREWLNYYKDLSLQYDIEYAVHGCYHYQFENPFFGHHQEFSIKSEDESRIAVSKALYIFSDAGLMPKGFRPPGWGMNSDLSLILVLRENQFLYIAGSSYDGGFNIGRQNVSNYYPSYINGLLNIPQNIELDWSINKIYSEIKHIVDQRGIISIKGHFVSGVFTNSLNKNNLQKLYQIVSFLKQNYPTQIEYSTMHTIAERYLAYFQND